MRLKKLYQKRGRSRRLVAVNEEISPKGLSKKEHGRHLASFSIRQNEAEDSRTK